MDKGRRFLSGAPGLLFGLRLTKTLFVSAASSSADGFTLPSFPFPQALQAIALTFEPITTSKF